MLDVDQVKKTGTQDALANILRPSLPPVLVVYDRIVAPPRSLALVIEARDSGPEIVRHAAEQVLEMGFPLAASGQDGLTPMHVIVGIGAGFDWWEERAALAGEMNDGLGSLGIAPGAPWPTLVRHIPGALRLLEPELVVLLSDPVTVDGKARMRRVADYALRSMTPVLALTSGRVLGPLEQTMDKRSRTPAARVLEPSIATRGPSTDPLRRAMGPPNTHEPEVLVERTRTLDGPAGPSSRTP